MAKQQCANSSRQVIPIWPSTDSFLAKEIRCSQHTGVRRAKRVEMEDKDTTTSTTSKGKQDFHTG